MESMLSCDAVRRLLAGRGPHRNHILQHSQPTEVLFLSFSFLAFVGGAAGHLEPGRGGGVAHHTVTTKARGTTHNLEHLECDLQPRPESPGSLC